MYTQKLTCSLSVALCELSERADTISSMKKHCVFVPQMPCKPKMKFLSCLLYEGFMRLQAIAEDKLVFPFLFCHLKETLFKRSCI